MDALPLDALFIIIEHITCQRDLSALSRCNHTLHTTLVPRLYGDIRFSICEVAYFARAMGTNSLFCMHCKRLSLTAKTYESVESFTENDLEFVIKQCIIRGPGLSDLSWDTMKRDRMLGSYLHVLSQEECLTSLSKSLRKLDVNMSSFDQHEGRLAFLTLIKYPFPLLSTLRLNVYFEYGVDIKELWLFLSRLPSLRLLHLAVIANPVQCHSEDNTVVPNVVFPHLKSLRMTVTKWPSGKTYSKRFLEDQPSLIEVDIDSDHVRTSSRLKALLVRFLERWDAPNKLPDLLLEYKLDSITVLRIHTMSYNFGGSEWSNFIDAFTNLGCLEIARYYTEHELGDYKNGDRYDFLPKIEARIVEFGVAHEVRFYRDYLYDAMASDCVSSKRLDNLLESCSTIASIRAFRLSFTSEDKDSQWEKVECDLPDELTLDRDKIPQALEFVLWEVPWKQRLYRVSREPESTKLIPTGYAYLPGRPHYPTLTWSNDSVFDHVGE